MKTLSVIVSLSIGLLISLSAQGQRLKEGLPIRVSLLNEAVSLPSASRLVKDINPGLRVGTEFYYRHGRRHQWLQTVNLGGFYHQELATSLFVTSEVNYRFIGGRVTVDLKAGPGYLLNRSTVPIYRDAGGEYVKTAGFEHRFLVTTGLSVGIRIGRIMPFVGYDVMVQAPFLQNNSLFLPHQLLQAGIVTKLGRRAIN